MWRLTSTPPSVYTTSMIWATVARLCSRVSNAKKKIVSVVSKIISTLFYLYHSMTRRRLKNCLMFFLSFYKEGLSNNELYFTTSDCRFSALLLGKIATIFLDKQTISTVRLELFKEANFCSAWQHCKSSLLSKFDKRRKTSGL